MQIHTCNQNNDVSLDKEFQQHLTKIHSKNGVIDQGKYKKRFMEIKLTDRQYHFQDNATVSHKHVKFYFNTNQFPALSFCGPHSKLHGARGLSKHYYWRFDTKLGYGICANHRILCACIACTSKLDKPWMSGIPPNEQERYKPATNLTYWPVLRSFKHWSIIQLSRKSTPYDAFDEIHQVFYLWNK